VKTIVVDASVAVKWFFSEIHSEAACRLLKVQQELLAPDLIWAEVANAIWKKLRNSQITSEEARGVLQEFKRLPLETYASKALLESAWDLAEPMGITIYDSLYLALALSRDCALITADRTFYSTLQGKPLASTLMWIEHAS